ncbi:hypothetical protein Pf1_01989 [Flavobacterium columnare]|nr:hypothetical protein [Flavobacterium columnare]ANO47444.1 hypothetical protein Pf1_01989 [Flavobacterium columnare]
MYNDIENKLSVEAIQFLDILQKRKERITLEERIDSIGCSDKRHTT